MNDKIEVVNRFNNIKSQLVCVLGSEGHAERIRKTLASLNFAQVRAARDITQVDRESQFLVIVVDFNNLPAVQFLTKSIASIEGFSGVITI